MKYFKLTYHTFALLNVINSESEGKSYSLLDNGLSSKA